MKWWTLALLALLPVLQGDPTPTQVSPTENDIPREEEIGNEFSSNLDLDSNPEFVEELSEETMGGDSIEKASSENTEKPAQKLDGELPWKSREDTIWEHGTDYTWEYGEDVNWESSGHTSEEFNKEATNDSSPGMTMVNTTVRPSMKMVSVLTKEPTAAP